MAKTKREKLENKLEDTFVKEMKVKNEAQLKESLIFLVKEVKKIDDSKKEDKTLFTLKEQIADLNAGYKDLRAAQTIKMNYIFELMKERGTF